MVLKLGKNARAQHKSDFSINERDDKGNVFNKHTGKEKLWMEVCASMVAVHCLLVGTVPWLALIQKLNPTHTQTASATRSTHS